MMTKQSLDLANRLKIAIEQQRADAEQTRLEAERKQREAQDARAALFGDLVEFGKAIEYVDVRKVKSGVHLAFDGRTVIFEPDDSDDGVQVRVDGEAKGSRVSIRRQVELGNRWVVRVERQSKEELVPLFLQGLEWIMVSLLRLPSPSHE